jgi:hypothetical protein
MPRIAPARLAVLLGLVLTVTLVQPLVGSASASTIPKPAAPAFKSAIDSYGAYQGQSTCDPNSKPGVLRTKDLLNATYGTRTIGIVRSCSSGGTSEHKEGRALDWMINAKISSQKAVADSFVAWLLATDSHGNKHAMMRRLGIMYIIWNNRMFRAYDPGRGWTEYKSCFSGGDDTSCHRDHVHLSFTWDGALAKTSFYGGSVPVAINASVNDRSPYVGETVQISGSVSPVAGAVGTKVYVKWHDGTKWVTVGNSTVDSWGRFTHNYVVSTSGAHRLKIYKPGVDCTGTVCAYARTFSSEFGLTAGSRTQGAYTVTMTASPGLVPVGTPVRFTGTVTPSNVAAGGRVAIKVYDTALGRYSALTATDVRSNGTYEAVVELPLGRNRYMVHKAADDCTDGVCTWAAGASKPAYVDVRTTVPYDVTASASLKSVPVGGSTVISGSVAPSYASPGSTVVLRRLEGDTLRTVTDAPVDASGRFKIPVTSSSVGSRTYRVYKAADGCAGDRCDFGASLSDPIAITTVPVQPFDVKVAGSGLTLVGKKVRVAAAFRPSVTAAYNQVTIQEYRNGVWASIARRPLSATGGTEFFRTYNAPGVHKFRFLVGADECASGVCAFKATTSPVVTIQAVRPDSQRLSISAALSATKVSVGDRVALSGTVKPSSYVAGTSVKLARLIGGRYVTVRTAKVAADGGYRFAFTATRSGTFDYRVIHEGAGCSGSECLFRRSNSAARILTVR